MVHLRINERESNPNPWINFISVLPSNATGKVSSSSSQDARQLMRALAAQVKPVMKNHGFSINSLEEYEYNRVFAGRNWNNGETIELVLRGANGAFLPVNWLMSTLCHELAHIQHMNHGPAFQRLWTQLRNDVRNLQSKGYYGDGYWSAGTRLIDSAKVDGRCADSSEFPEYMCGGAHARARPTSIRRRRASDKKVVPSNHTGAQTAKKRRPGSRLTAQGIFIGKGISLNDGPDNEQKNGIGFRKKATSKRARDERASAAEKRIQEIQGFSTFSKNDSIAYADVNEEESFETDEDRRRVLEEVMGGQDLDLLRSKHHDYSGDFDLPSRARADKTDLRECDTDSLEARHDRHVSNVSSLAGMGKGKGKGLQIYPSTTVQVNSRSRTSVAENPRPSKKARLLQTRLPLSPIEVGVATGTSNVQKLDRPATKPTPKSGGSKNETCVDSEYWECLVCTLHNKIGHLACSACGTPLQ